jgi:hypothetical protein
MIQHKPKGTGMNNKKRMEMMDLTDIELEKSINKYSKSADYLSKTKYMKTTKISVGKKLQALVDEKQSRMIAKA